MVDGKWDQARRLKLVPTGEVQLSAREESKAATHCEKWEPLEKKKEECFTKVRSVDASAIKVLENWIDIVGSEVADHHVIACSFDLSDTEQSEDTHIVKSMRSIYLIFVG